MRKDKIDGGLADKLSIYDIAKKHECDISSLLKQLVKGIEIEMEHTSSEEVATEIALDHLFELPDYYNRLEKMENDKVMNENKKDSKAKVRNRGKVVFPAGSKKVKDDKDHFPINDEGEARNALSRANQYDESPSWYEGSKQELLDKVVSMVKKHYPSIDVSKEAEKSKVNESENISDFARRMRELAGLAEGNQKKRLKTVEEGESTFEGGATFTAKDLMKEGVEFDSGEEESFESHGYYTLGNSGGYEVMISDSGDSARVRDAYGSSNPETSDWLEIEYVYDEETGEHEPIIDPKGYSIPLNMVIRNNSLNENREEETFETHKFEQKTIEEGESDDLYTLNENTIIVLDFLKDTKKD